MTSEEFADWARSAGWTIDSTEPNAGIIRASRPGQTIIWEEIDLGVAKVWRVRQHRRPRKSA